jgi:glycerophosphoryl diester phosphodiesterase
MLASLGLVLTATGASAAVSPNPWLDRHFLNIAHQGGEDEAPSNTMYAFKSAAREAHADMLELDVHLTSDGQLVVLHDDTFTRTSCLPALCPGPTSSTEPTRPASQIRGMTLAQVQALDAGYWFRPGTYSHDYALADSAYPFRGIRTGAKAPPKGYKADDFRIPTLFEVLNTFPKTPINIEIKMPKSQDPANPYPADCGTADGSGPSQLCDDLGLTAPTTEALAAVLNGAAAERAVTKRWNCKNDKGKQDAVAKTKSPKPKKCKKTTRKVRRDDIIVVSFAQEPMVEFASLAPSVHRAPSLPSLSGYAFSNQPLAPDPVAFQVPPLFGGVKAPALLLGQPFFAHNNGYAIHVWTDGDQDETYERYGEMVSLGVDGIMTTSPRKLNEFLCLSDVPHPNGTSRCASAVKKKKCKAKKGTAAAGKKACKKGKRK